MSTGIHASVVSHGHGTMVEHVVGELLGCPEVQFITITLNIPERLEFPQDTRITVASNPVPRGYGANHNAAWVGSTAPFFCVLNPDLRLVSNPFPALLAAMQDIRLAASAPVITDADGKREDSARKFPTVASLLRKALGRDNGTYATEREAADPDWLAGMFLMLSSSAFREVGGFDERYFLYYEDVDLCWRLRRRGHAVRQVLEVTAIHDARRASRKDWRHARWHLASMARFLARSGLARAAAC
jgi:N-acetylglucosaminyl-diphospho-decaprenol L-rhamnosyltransferase